MADTAISGAQLADAITQGDAALVLRYIEQGQSPNAKIVVPHPLNNTEYKTFPVHYAVQRTQVELVKLLMKHGANPRLIDGDRYTAKNWLQHMRSQPHEKEEEYNIMETALNSGDGDPRLSRSHSNPSFPRSRSSSRSSSKKRSSRRQSEVDASGEAFNSTSSVVDLEPSPSPPPHQHQHQPTQTRERASSRYEIEVDQEAARAVAHQYKEMAAGGVPANLRPTARPPHSRPPPTPDSGCAACLIS